MRLRLGEQGDKEVSCPSVRMTPQGTPENTRVISEGIKKRQLAESRETQKACVWGAESDSL